MVQGPEEENGPGEPKDAQLRDQQEARRGVEAALRLRETSVHRRGQAAAGSAHEGAPGLQVQTQAQTQESPEEGPLRFPAAVFTRGRRGAPEGIFHGLLSRPRG